MTRTRTRESDEAPRAERTGRSVTENKAAESKEAAALPKLRPVHQSRNTASVERRSEGRR
jgi:hypothetical protein